VFGGNSTSGTQLNDVWMLSGLAVSNSAITSLNPTSATAGGPTFTLTVNGTNLVSGCVVQWNGSALTTTFVSATQLTASVPPSLITSPGSSSITAACPGGTSLALPLAINAPPPTLTALNPTSATLGGPAFTLTANGTNFVSGSTMFWNGTVLTTAFVSAAQLTASVPASLIASSGSSSITVMNPGGAMSNSLTFTIVALTITTTALPGGTVGTPYSQGLSASGGTAPYSNWALKSGILPPGLALNATTGVISGIPSTAQTSPFNFSIAVNDSTGATSPPQSFSITISQAPSLTIITPSPLPQGTIGVSYTQTLNSVGGTPPYTWSVSSGAPPTGLSLSPSGVLAGTPISAVAVPPAGVTSSFTVSVVSGGISASATLSLTILPQAPPLAIPGGDINPVTVTSGVIGLPIPRHCKPRVASRLISGQ
jgi:hypothetical protein